MLQLGIRIDGIPTVVAEYRAYSAQLPRAMVRAINRSIASVRTAMVREMSRDTGLKSKDVRDALALREATINRIEASLAAKLKRIPLIDFNAKGPEPSRGKGRGVSYKLPGSPGRIPNAFIATMPSGHRGVFVRKAKARLGIQELFGPSLGHVFGKYRPLGIARAQEVLVTNLRHELAFAGGDASVGVVSASGTD